MVSKPHTYSILGVNVSNINITSSWDYISGWINSRTRAYICVAPVSTIVDCNRDAAYKAIVNNADMVTPDGMPLVWYGKITKVKGLGRVSGADFMNYIFQKSCETGYTHYFYGGMPETLEKLKEKLKGRFPELKIVGMYSPPFRKSGEMEDEKIVEHINSLRPDFIWVGLGAPKQDVWMANHRKLLEAPILAGVGAAFDFLAGIKPRAPKWMRSIGMEWFFRLCCEPRRLWKRYLVGNSLFLWYLIRQCFPVKNND